MFACCRILIVLLSLLYSVIVTSVKTIAYLFSKSVCNNLGRTIDPVRAFLSGIFSISPNDDDLSRIAH